MRLSIIIPTYNEVKRIKRLVSSLYQNGGPELEEILVADGGSTDGTIEEAKLAGAIVLEVGKKSRATQMNFAAKVSKGDVLYFVHADTIPPKSYTADIAKALDLGFLAGSYRFKFETNKKILGINSFFTRFNTLVCRGGDQSMYVQKELFNILGCFDEQYVIMEDFDFIQRLRKQTKFHVIPKEIVVSDRKYDNNSYLRVQIANLLAFSMFKRGVNKHRIKSLYEKMLNLNYE